MEHQRTQHPEHDHTPDARKKHDHNAPSQDHHRPGPSGDSGPVAEHAPHPEHNTPDDQPADWHEAWARQTNPDAHAEPAPQPAEADWHAKHQQQKDKRKPEADPTADPRAGAVATTTGAAVGASAKQHAAKAQIRGGAAAGAATTTAAATDAQGAAAREPAPDRTPDNAATLIASGQTSVATHIASEGDDIGPDYFTAANAALVLRAGLILGELVPGIGVFSGLLGVGMDTFTNLKATAQLPDRPEVVALRAFIVGRQAIGLVQAVTGHISLLAEYIQDGALLSILGWELTPFTAGANEVILTINTVLDSWALACDCASLVLVELAEARGLHGSALDELEISFGTSILADAAALILDLVGIGTLGGANPEAVEKPVTAAIKNARLLDRFMRAVALRLQRINTPGIADAVANPGLDGALDAGFDSRNLVARNALTGVRNMRAAYTEGNATIQWLTETASTLTSQGETFVADTTGLVNPAADFATGLADHIDAMTRDLQAITSSRESTQKAQQEAQHAHGQLDQAQSKISQLVLPAFEPPAPTDLGDGLLADAGELLIDKGKELGQAAARKAYDTVQSMLDDVKAKAAEELDQAREEVQLFEDFFTGLNQRLDAQTQHLNDTIQAFTEKLADCQSADDILQLLADQARQIIEDVLGLSIDDLRAQWTELGPQLEQAEQKLLEALHANGEDAHDEEAPSGAPAPD